MIIVVVRHFVLPGMREAAKARLIANAERMIQQPGCLFRHTGEREDGTELVTVTGWSSEEYKLAWDELRKAVPPAGAMHDYYSGYEVIESQVFDQRPPGDCRNQTGPTENEHG